MGKKPWLALTAALWLGLAITGCQQDSNNTRQQAKNNVDPKAWPTRTGIAKQDATNTGQPKNPTQPAVADQRPLPGVQPGSGQGLQPWQQDPVPVNPPVNPIQRASFNPQQ